jgi:hypothetical protein
MELLQVVVEQLTVIMLVEQQDQVVPLQVRQERLLKYIDKLVQLMQIQVVEQVHLMESMHQLLHQQVVQQVGLEE